MFWIPEDAVFKGRVKVLKPACSYPGWSSGRAEAAKGGSKRYCECLGNSLGELAGNIALSEGWIITRIEVGDSWEG